MEGGHHSGVAVTLEGKIYSCSHCKTHLAIGEDILSKSIHCRHGRAYLFSEVANVSTGEREERMMMTGMHAVADISCVRCGEIVGWKYETAHEQSQRYKEGKYLLGRNKLVGPDGSNDCATHDADIIEGSDADDV